MTPAYVISEYEILDGEMAEQYLKYEASSIAVFGGYYIVSSDEPEVLEGEETGRKMVIVRFPSMNRLREWYKSLEYAKAMKLRRQAMALRMIFTEGLKDAGL